MSSAFSERYRLTSASTERGVSPPVGHREQRIPAELLLLYRGRLEAGLYGSPPLLPLFGPVHARCGVYECPFEPAFIQKRNERERQRVRCVNQGYAQLRAHLPGGANDKRMSKVETLRAAIRYIKHLQRLVEARDRAESPPTPSNSSTHGEESQSTAGS